MGFAGMRILINPRIPSSSQLIPITQPQLLLGKLFLTHGLHKEFLEFPALPFGKLGKNGEKNQDNGVFFGNSQNKELKNRLAASEGQQRPGSSVSQLESRLEELRDQLQAEER